MAQLTFLGATGEVTGSRYLIETETTRLLLECGLQQGGRQAGEANQASLKALADSVDAVVLSHGHLDHAGLLPKLVRDGYRGPIYCTTGTRDLLHIMLRDSAHVMSKDVEWENKWRQRAGKDLIEPLYNMDDVEAALDQCCAVDYGHLQAVGKNIQLKFHDAGHILGSAIVEMVLQDGGRSRHLVFSGDLGNPDSVLMNTPARLTHADLVMLESTYGNRDHRPLEETIEELAGILKEAHEAGGNVLIPAFAVGRTQEVLYHLGRLHHQGRLPQQKVFLDSPMGIQVTELYARRRKLLNGADMDELDRASGGDLQRYLPQLQFTRRVEESMAINQITGGAIIIAGAGMCNGGRITHHFKYNLWRRQTHLVIVGFQAQGTLGRKLVDGAKRIKVLGNELAVAAKVHTLGGLSAHAGQSALLDWAGAFKNQPVFHMVHGEPEAREALAEALRTRAKRDARVPELGQTVEI
ncbi:beta-lactamase [Ectothiorhodospira haloalkaliphila]|uniref:Beta-lactamase n=1 Tax=Ectothiorhodospira haloalkaliphila TaxID=421628 RepID=W8L8X3_9GAMM|nr:MBL fold metallo-hydrolase [Ectothiorhodospira haloalkaliphila]AHK80285.1 beta-lactamase [Ectothiorhodospira haloalkaliphila]